MSKCCGSRTSLWSHDLCGGSGESYRFENTDRCQLRYSSGIVVYETSNRAITRSVACHAQYARLRPNIRFVKWELMRSAYRKPKTANVTPARRLSRPDGRSLRPDLVYCRRAIAGRERQKTLHKRGRSRNESVKAMNCITRRCPAARWRFAGSVLEWDLSSSVDLPFLTLILIPRQPHWRGVSGFSFSESRPAGQRRRAQASRSRR